MFGLFLIFLVVFMSSFGQLAMKQGMIEVGRIGDLGSLLQPAMLFKILTNKYVFAGIFLHAVAVIFWLGALSTLDVSYVYPLASLGYIITAVFAYVFLNEEIVFLRASGILLVVLGSYLIIRT